MTAADVIVAGGGIVGLCAALRAADRGLRVTVVDDERSGAASRASAGILGPSLEGLPASLRAVAMAARDLYPDLVADLEERSGVAVTLDRSGILELAAFSHELDILVARAGADSRALDDRELARLEPALAGHAGGVCHALDGSVDNVTLMQALVVAAQRHPRITLLPDRVTAVALLERRARITLSNGDWLHADSLVIATGAWVKGELLTLRARSVRHVVYTSGGYLVPRGDLLLVGATSEDAGSDARVSTVGGAALRKTAAAIVPSLASAAVVKHWAGLRPCSPDGLPLLGRDREYPALLYAAGFSRNGILLGPWAGEAIAALLSGVDPSVSLVSFEPDRFEGLS